MDFLFFSYQYYFKMYSQATHLDRYFINRIIKVCLRNCYNLMGKDCHLQTDYSLFITSLWSV